MTAPDSRDSVAAENDGAVAVVGADGYPHWLASYLLSSEWVLKTGDWLYTKDRLQALARGPQQAGGEDAEIREILFGALDRDRDNITTRNLVVVAVNSLQRERERAETAEAALREAGRDAERYRWMNRQDSVVVYQGNSSRRDHLITGKKMDAWIDAAIDAAIEQAAG